MRSRLTSVLDPGSRAAANGQTAPAHPAPLARQRRRSMLWLGVALAALGALTVAWLFTATGHRVPVLAVSRDVPAGAVITQSDLSVATVSGSGMTTIPARQESQVTGRTAAVGLQSGALLVPSDLTSASVPGPGEQLVPVPLKSDDVPASGLAPGDQVLVIATPGSGGEAGAGQSGAPALTGSVPATVYQVSGASQSGNVTVDLIVSAQNGGPVARQASTGQIAIIVTPRNG
jgi:SAF domain